MASRLLPVNPLNRLGITGEDAKPQGRSRDDACKITTDSSGGCDLEVRQRERGVNRRRSRDKMARLNCPVYHYCAHFANSKQEDNAAPPEISRRYGSLAPRAHKLYAI